MAAPKKTNPPEDVDPTAHNPWDWDATFQPYLHNFFTLMDLNPAADHDERADKENQLENQTRVGQSTAFCSKAVDEAYARRCIAVNEDGLLLANERLLAHKRHLFDSEGLADVTGPLLEAATTPPEALLPLPVADLGFLLPLMPTPEQISVDIPKPEGQPDLRELGQPTAEEEVAFDT